MSSLSRVPKGGPCVTSTSVAKSNGAKLQRFCDCIFGKDRQLWNRDIDRTPPGRILRDLSSATRISRTTIEALTLRAYRGRLFRSPLATGQQRWILPLGMYHRKRLGFGLQFCPKCLSEASEPYFRKRCRIPFTHFVPSMNAYFWTDARVVGHQSRSIGENSADLMCLRPV